MNDNRIGNANLEMISVGPASFNCEMLRRKADEIRGELWLTDLPKLGLLLVSNVSCGKMRKMVVKGIAICVRSCIGIPRHVICRFGDAAFLYLADLQSEGWRIRSILMRRMC